MTNTALGELEFLIRSNQRVSVLQRLAVSQCSRYELHSELGVPQSTLGRILGEFQDRGWTRRDGDVHELTPLGEILVDELASVLRTLEMVLQMSDIVDHLPLGEMDFDHQCLQGATITTASAHGVASVVQRMVEMVQSAGTLRIITHVEYDATLEDHKNAVVDGEQELEVVVSRSVLDEILADAGQSRLLIEILQSDRAEFYSFDGTFPYVMGIRDDQSAGIAAVDNRGIPLGFVQTDHESVCNWVVETIDRYRRQATPVSVSMVTSRSSSSSG